MSSVKILNILRSKCGTNLINIGETFITGLQYEKSMFGAADNDDSRTEGGQKLTFNVFSINYFIICHA